MSAHASAASQGATSSIFRPQVWLGGGCVALLALVAWLGAGVGVSKAAGPECSNEAIRIAQGATRLPDCRAYEQISPADSTGGVVGMDPTNKLLFGAIAADGSGAAFGSSSAVGQSERGALRTSNLARRTADGWSSYSVLTTPRPDVEVNSAFASRPTPSADMSRMLIAPPVSLGPPNQIIGSGGGSIYLSAPEGKGPPTWLSRWSFPGVQPNTATGTALPLGGSPDFSSGYFRYATPLTDIAGDDLRVNDYGLYHFEGETITPAGVLPSGTVSPEGAVPAGTGARSMTSGPEGVLPRLARNQVSADGSKLFFVSPAESAEPKQLYVEEGGAPGRLVSHDALGAPAPNGVVLLNTGFYFLDHGYASATRDGKRVLFASEDALTDDAPATGVKIYRAEITPSEITVTYLPGVNGYPMAIDADASTILVAVPVSEETVSFKVWDEEHPDAPDWVATDLSSFDRAMYEPVFSDDGDVLVFASDDEIEPGVAPRPELFYLQAYRWTKQSEVAVCVSCRRDGGAPARFGGRMSNFNGIPTDNPAFPAGSSPDYFNQSSVVGNRRISSDGSRVFFDTSDPLDPARDVNGTRDVYMWEGGEVHLLTSGRNSIPSYVIDNSASGSDVMLLTKDGLIPSDTNQTYDIYDVRVDGGFAEPIIEGCEGDACQGQGTSPRQAAVPASSMLAGAGNKPESRKGKPRSRKALVTTQLGRPGPSSARVRIQVPAAGKVSIAGSDVKSKSRQVKGGTVVIAVGLSEAGKQKLARRGQLKTTVKVTFRPQSGAVTKKSMKLSFAGQRGAR